jgi:hypothetical protein
MLVHFTSALLWPYLFWTCDSRFGAAMRRGELRATSRIRSKHGILALIWMTHRRYGFWNQFLLVENIMRRENSLPSIEFINCLAKEDLSAVECFRFRWGHSYCRWFMTVRTIFARYVSSLIHRSNRPVQAMPGGRCVDLSCFVPPTLSALLNNEDTVQTDCRRPSIRCNTSLREYAVWKGNRLIN